MNHISIIGIGYSNADLSTKEIEIIKKSEVIIGHIRFTNRIKCYVNEDCIVSDVRSASSNNYDFRQERVNLALEYVKKGMSVLVVSCGDAALYGMANYLLIEAEKRGVKVSIYPGIGAVNYVTKLLGTPLHLGYIVDEMMNDNIKLNFIGSKLENYLNTELPLILLKPLFNAQFYLSYNDHEQIYREKPAETARNIWSEFFNILEATRKGSKIYILSDLGSNLENVQKFANSDFNLFFNSLSEMSLVFIPGKYSINLGEYLVCQK